jgi:tetratricopeptide (TPR) repeat protein
MTEEILNVLAKVKEMRVSARTSTFALRNRELTARQWGDTLGVGYLVEGSVRKAGDMVRITAQLIDTSDGSHLWSDNFDRPLANVFQIQSEIAEKIADALTVPLGLEEGQSLTTPTADLEAYDLYLAGRQQMRRRGSGVAEAVTLFEAAIARDSAWAPAWAGLAESRALVVYYDEVANDSASWAEHLGAAEQAANRALALDPDNASALVALGNVYRDRWEWEEAEVTYLRALAADPDNVEAHQGYAEFLGYVGRNFEATDAARRALAMDRTPIRLNIAGFLTFRIDPEAGIELLREAIQADTDGDVTRNYLRGNLLQSYALAGRWEEHWQAVVDRRVDTDDPNRWIERFRTYWPEAGPPPRIAIDSLGWSPYSRAFFLALTGRHEEALDYLEEALNDRAPFGGNYDLLAPRHDPIRDNPRFQALLARRGMAGRVRQDRPPNSASAP